MGIMLVLFALSMAVATFIENDFGSAAAYSFVYNTKWFESILLLLVINLTGQIFTFKLFRKTKLTILFFHLAFVIMIIGAAITRYFGYEGTIHIREGQEENKCYSSSKYIGYTIKDAAGNLLAENLTKYSLTSRSADNYRKRINIDGEEFKIELSKVIPNAAESEGAVIGIDPSENVTGKTAFIFNVSEGDKSATFTLLDNEDQNIVNESFQFNGKQIELSYGSRITSLPFSIKLNDFILERYPGSSSPSGYKSNVVLIDKESDTEKPFLIFMNNILKYKGYRFYQSSFDKDEKGTILSVNHDNAGMIISYTGYCLLFIFIILSIVNRKSVFHIVNPGYWNSPFKRVAAILVLMLLLSGVSAVSAQKLIPDKKIAEDFGKVLVQDQKGRTKPLYTLSNDILRKVTRKNDFDGMTSMQVFLGCYLDFDKWKDVKLIRISNSDIQRKLGIAGSFASFNDLVNLSQGGLYKLSDDVNKAYNKSPGERNKFDKEVMKVDERVNIIYMIYTGSFVKLFPLKDPEHSWGPPEEAIKHAISKEDSLYLTNIIPMLNEAIRSGNISNARQIAGSISDYQKRFAGYALPSESRSKAELFYYKSKIFERLFPFYATVGLIMLITLLVMVIRGIKGNSLFIRGLGWLLFAGFLFHTLGLGLRWYIAGHSPMSNGYESMIFISWMTLLAGFIFSRKSPFALSATAVLGAMTLMVAHLSFMDPEITNLVPVLKSYWLTLHVSVITGSYGFLGLGAILGLINMILMALSGKRNHERIGNTIEELTVISYKTLTLGLYFLTIGTFLGAVWANESWGRYWGWDPKETWSLITVIIYSLVIHSRMIPSLKDIYSFNILSLFAFSCVLMTYFGVNYYLSGMHSYASGDPVPVPSFVYISVILLAALSLFAYFKYTNWNKVADI
jgi:cytochrome c-type biogenesis protein CcsB